MRFTKIITALFMLAASQSIAQKSLLSLEKGEKITIRSTSKMTSSTEAMGQSIENNIDMSTTQVADITNVKNDVTTISMVIAKVNVSVQTMGQEMTYDSDKKDNEGQLAEAINKYINVPVVFKLDNQGVEIKKETIIPENAFDGISIGIYQGNLTEMGFIKKQVLGRKLSTGLSWEDSSTAIKDDLTIKNNGVFTVENIENGLTTFTYKGTSVISGTMEQMGQEIEINSNNKVSSRFVIDLKSGIVLNENATTSISSKMYVAGMEIPTTGTNTYSMNVKVN